MLRAMGDLVLTGSPLELALPDICARCGEPAKGRLYWERVFEFTKTDTVARWRRRGRRSAHNASPSMSAK
jgi:hypothetical protein